MALVSIIIPSFNEEATITLLLNAIYEQTYPRSEIEVIIADGMSTDKTRDVILAFKNDHPDLHLQVVDNLKRNIPSGLNRAIEAASGEFLIRLDAHSIPVRDYVSRCIATLREGFGDNVGGVWKIEPGRDGWVADSIASAASHPLGVGDARYRLGGKPQAVDTVPFGAFRRRLIDNIGPFDESLLSNEDYEFNARIRNAGGVVWMNPGICSTYFARGTYRDLARQYWRYGYWKAQMLVRYPGTFRWRQLAGAFVLTLLVLGVLSIWFPVARWVLAIEAGIYGFILLYSGVQMALRQRRLHLLYGLPAAIATMHFSWGSAFIWSLFEYFVKRVVRRS